MCVFWKGAPNAAVYFTLTLPEGVEGVLTGVQLVSEGVADRAELHTHVREGNIMRMAKVDQMAIPGTLELKPGGDHVMVMGMKRDLKVGETINLLLTLDQGEPIPVTVTVAPPAWTPTPPSQKGSSCCGAH